MKTLSAAMTAHIQRRVLTLATCWTITRTDGVVLHLTDHDRDVVFGGDTYAAATGVDRTAIKSGSDLSADNLEVDGILAGAITAEDLEKGLYDFASVEIFSVNWQDPDGHGKIQHRVGNLGEVKTRDQGYEVELRGLNQLLGRRRGKLASAACRADLGSPLVNVNTGRADGCGVDLDALKESTEVESVTSRRVFVVPAGTTLRTEPDPTTIIDGDVRRVTFDGEGYMVMCHDISDGTETRPIIVNDSTDLNNVRNNLHAHYVLGANIDLTSFGNWTPIGDDTSPFAGVFDGAGYEIRNMTSNGGGSQMGGLFGTVTGEVRRVGLIQAVVSSGSASIYAGTVVAHLVGDNGSHPLQGAATVTQCWVLGGTLTTDGDQAGGLVGHVDEEARVTNCFVAMLVSGVVGTDAGGVIGRAINTTHIVGGLYWNTDAAGITDPGNVASVSITPLLDAEWIVQANFSGQDFVDVVKMNAGALTGAPSLTFISGAPDLIVRSAGSFLNDRLFAHEKITVSGSPSNDGTHIVRAAAPTLLALSTSSALTSEGPVGGVDITSEGGPRLLGQGRFS